jgi:hypothetical protein
LVDPIEELEDGLGFLTKVDPKQQELIRNETGNAFPVFKKVDSISDGHYFKYLGKCKSK